MRNAEDIKAYLKVLADEAAALNSAVSALVLAGIDRLSPAEALTNRWRRRSARRRVVDHHIMRLVYDETRKYVDTPPPTNDDG